MGARNVDDVVMLVESECLDELNLKRLDILKLKRAAAQHSVATTDKSGGDHDVP